MTGHQFTADESEFNMDSEEDGVPRRYTQYREKMLENSGLKSAVETSMYDDPMPPALGDLSFEESLPPRRRYAAWLYLKIRNRYIPHLLDDISLIFVHFFKGIRGANIVQINM